MDTRAQTQRRQECAFLCVSVVGVNLHVNEIAASVSDSNRVRAGDAMFDVRVCGLLCGLCLGPGFAVGVRFVFVSGEHGWVSVQKSLTDISGFVCPVLLVLQAGLYVTQAVRWQVKQILSNKVSILSCPVFHFSSISTQINVNIFCSCDKAKEQCEVQLPAGSGIIWLHKFQPSAEI